MSQLTQFTTVSGGAEPKGSITTQFPFSAEALIQYNNDFYVKTGTRVTGLTSSQQTSILAATDDFMLPVSNTVMASTQAGSSSIGHSFVYGNSVYLRSTITGIIRSTDGVSWTPVEITNAYATNSGNLALGTITKLVFGVGMFMVAIDVSAGGTSPPVVIVATSTDGLTWTCSPVSLNVISEPYGQSQQLTYYDLEFDGTYFWLGSYQVDTAGTSWYYTATKSADGKTWLQYANNSYGGNYGRTKITTGGGNFTAHTIVGGILASGTSYGWYGTTTTINATGVSPYNTNDICTQLKYLNGLFFYLRNGASSANTTAAISTSPTGQTWTGRTLPIATWLYDIAWNGTVYCAVGVSGHIFTSTDAATWTQQTSGTSEQLVSVEWDSSLSLFICVGVTTIRTSPTGVTWSTATIPSGLGTRSSNIPVAGISNILSKLNGTWFTTVGSSDHIISSTNGTTWTMVFVGGQLSTSATVVAGSTAAITNNALFKLNTLMVACPVAGGIMTAPLSTNSWTLTANISIGVFNAVAYGAGLYVAVGNGGILYTSPDGITWTSRTSGTATNLTGIAWSGAEFIATSSTIAIRSTNGTSWSAAGSNGGSLMCYSGGIFIVSNGSTTIRLSADGVTWINSTISSSSQMRAFSNGALVYGGTVGTAYIITNSGIKVYIQNSATQVVTSITEINGNLYILLDSGSNFVILSPPLYYWTSGVSAVYNSSANGLPGTTTYFGNFGSNYSGVKIGSNTYTIPTNSPRVGCIYGMSTFGYEVARILTSANAVFYNGSNIWAATTTGLAWAPKSMPCSLSQPISIYSTVTSSTIASATPVSMIAYRKIT